MPSSNWNIQASLYLLKFGNSYHIGVRIRIIYYWYLVLNPPTGPVIFLTHQLKYFPWLKLFDGFLPPQDEAQTYLHGIRGPSWSAVFSSQILLLPLIHIWTHHAKPRAVPQTYWAPLHLCAIVWKLLPLLPPLPADLSVGLFLEIFTDHRQVFPLCPHWAQWSLLLQLLLCHLVAELQYFPTWVFPKHCRQLTC